MMYPFMTLEDGTEVVHSDMKEDGSVEVYIEKPDENTVFVMLHAGSQIMIGRMSITFLKRISENSKKL